MKLRKRDLRQQVAYLEDSLDSDRNFSSRLLEGVGAVLDFLDRHLPEQFRPLVERARELLPVPELQQPEQEQERGHTWTAWSCKESLSRGGDERAAWTDYNNN